MATITLRISDELKESMDVLDEVNWSSVTRNLLEEKVKELYIQQRKLKAEEEYKQGKVWTMEQVEDMFKDE